MPTKDDLTYPVSLTPPDISAYRAGNIGVEYVHRFDSGKPGSHVMISAVVHGNELCGAIAVDHLLKNEARPLHGKLTMAFMNVRYSSDLIRKIPLCPSMLMKTITDFDLQKFYPGHFLKDLWHTALIVYL